MSAERLMKDWGRVAPVPPQREEGRGQARARVAEVSRALWPGCQGPGHFSPLISGFLLALVNLGEALTMSHSNIAVCEHGNHYIAVACPGVRIYDEI